MTPEASAAAKLYNGNQQDYDGFIKELKNRGIERAIEINQKAYDTFLGK